MKITPREKWQHAAQIFFPPRVAFSQFNSTQFARGVIFTRARVSLALLSLGKNGGLLARSVSRRSLGSTLSLRTLRDIYFGCLLFHWAQLFEGRLALTQGEILTWVSFSFAQKPIFPIIFSILFRASNHQILGKKNKTEFAFLAFISEFKFRPNPGLS